MHLAAGAVGIMYEAEELPKGINILSENTI